MLSTGTIEKAIELFEGGANESAVARATGLNNEEAKAVADALYFGDRTGCFASWLLPAFWSRRRRS
jgi:hypothetical protein